MIMTSISSRIVKFPISRTALLDRESRLDAVHIMTDNMIKSATAGDWDYVAEMQPKRAAMLEAALSTPFSHDEEASVQEHVLALREQNSKLIALVFEEKLRLKDALKTGRQKADAARAYLS